ncbi:MULTISPECIES: TetR/AcrR family transcriptional regulator [unclassified Pseudonocardia]|uniref:TetR/AcrR family transcriptional regulator n=1 Tax=unclassified Pseudonocardia TaxID=2619320 RepID=UPI00094AAF87|nr:MULTISPECIES: TetR/AcrR family transcriptional regulator [unclassified Pseudonocardia]OLM34615.1 Transcriptional regulator, TetR family [Pseudonocardia sp. Ae717_Ps2]
MPKVVDHGQRRGEIAEALWRIAAAEGLEAVSLARVAQEAGVSKGRVQHYFASRDELLDFAAQHLRLRVDERVRARMAAAAPSSPLGEVRALLVALLPLDDDARTDARVGSAFLIRALGDDRLRETYRTGDRLIRAAVADRLAAARDAGELAALDPDREATVLLALAGGLAESVLLGDADEAGALAVLDHQLGRLRP